MPETKRRENGKREERWGRERGGEWGKKGERKVKRAGGQKEFRSKERSRRKDRNGETERTEN
jgi:hypothetical protein